MLILSTTNQMMLLSSEIGELLSNKCSKLQHDISDRKIKQLGRLTRAAALLYVSAACFVLSGILGAFTIGTEWERIPEFVLILGVILVLVALCLLIIYGVHTIRIRMMQHAHTHVE